jgi:hypothetical protein
MIIHLERSRSLAADHHVTQGTSWLERSEGGANTADLSYAAFEFRLAIEFLAVRHWAMLLGRKVEEHDLHDLQSFKQIEHRIYELAGHQRQINGHYEFMRVVLHLLRIDILLITPNVGQLSKFWHECSDLCHIGWTLDCSVSAHRQRAFQTMHEARKMVLEQTSGLAFYPSIPAGSEFGKLRDQFTLGAASQDDVRGFLQSNGAWARIEFPHGRPSEFAGVPIPPTS